MKAVVAPFNQEKALVGAFSVITNLQMDLLFEALIQVRTSYLPHEILWGYQFRHNCVQFDSEEQKYEVSFDSFNDIVKDDTPRQDISNMLIKFTVI